VTSQCLQPTRLVAAAAAAQAGSAVDHVLLAEIQLSMMQMMRGLATEAHSELPQL
jgi:hypothetical protein